MNNLYKALIAVAALIIISNYSISFMDNQTTNKVKSGEWSLECEGYSDKMTKIKSHEVVSFKDGVWTFVLGSSSSCVLIK